MFYFRLRSGEDGSVTAFCSTKFVAHFYILWRENRGQELLAAGSGVLALLTLTRPGHVNDNGER